MRYRLPTLDILVVGAVLASGLVGVVLMYWLLGGASIVVTNNPVPTPGSGTAGSLSGVPCERYRHRPLAVMLATDPEARPLSGISQADMVFEMPVTPNGITRMMAVYQCQAPDAIGSIRSARQDFLPLAQGVDAILVHWGGERDTLAALNSGVMDNIDALVYEGTTFYREDDIPRPHNGFTTPELLTERADTLGYRATTSLDLYPRLSAPGERKLGSLADEVKVTWPQQMDVTFTYDASSNTYLRWRGGEPEIDADSGRQAFASVVVVMQTGSSFLYDQYIHVETIGSGVATVWQGGQRTNALWKKERATDMLQFTDSKGTPIPFERGTVWILIDTPLPST